MKTTTPIGMLYRDHVDFKERGYEPVPDKWDYNPQTQVSSLIEMGGPSEPTTTSMVAKTTGFPLSDSDEDNDDKGTD
ncbi:hypothetical protein [Dolichospermum sp. UHCC 0259]|uniref:hypothetical protein n=1 Tax=Dolichospermum sp. UHCC 0259 TaxID=2590010 RepID=UPI00144893D1|nr:hypothetical protein [Dolichospermum sp. UHCC 0259]MTJ49571.1 hypothetical protein [Dolichospermum sp. UHCC 0259]